MKKIYYSSVLMLMLIGGMVLTASSQEMVAQTVHVYEGDFNGSLLSGVQVFGEDAEGNSFEGTTDSNGAVTLYGVPGTWQFTFMKAGYDTLDLSHDVTQTGEGDVYLLRATQSQFQNQVAQTVYVYEGDFNGTMLSDVQVFGQDAAGNSFERITDSDGAVTIYGVPGTWQFTFMKEGYDTLDLSYDVTQTGAGAVYLLRADQSQDQADYSQIFQQTPFQPEPQQVMDYIA
jgi:hypothetical protein